ncbi:MAG: ShlB/FhaC/HecB family hemolysin secretion/activation protein [Pseudomonadota bacterium]
MKLLDYGPEISRLRRVARACAAGEMSRTQYRETRRRVLDELVKSRSASDDTVRRLAGDTTVRRDVVDLGPPQIARSSWPWIWLVAAMVALLFAATPSNALAADAQLARDIQIEPVPQRDLNPLTATRHQVEAVRWSPAVPLRALSQEAVNAFLNEQLHRQQHAEQPAEHGFSGRELEQVGRFLDALGVHNPNTRLSLEDVRDLQAMIESQKRRRGITVSQLELIAENLQAFVRDHGYPLARAYVPTQSSVDGVVELAVELGVLSEVVVQAGSGLSAAQSASVAEQMQTLVGAPVYGDAVKTRLNLLNRIGQQTLQAGFRAGADVGGSDMVLHYRDAAKFAGVVSVDNHGLEAFGAERLRYRGGSSGLWRGVDHLSVSLSATAGDENHYVGGIAYTSPLESRNMTLSAGLSLADAQFQGGGQQDITGDGVVAHAQLLTTPLFTRVKRREYRYRVGLQQWDWQRDATALLEQDVWYVGAGVQGHRLWDQQRLALQGQVDVTAGGLDGALATQDDNFIRIHGGARLWSPWQAFDRTLKLLVETRFQLSAASLPASQRFVVSSPAHNPGLEYGSSYADSAVEVSTQVRVPLNMGELGVFLEQSYGENNADDTWVQLSTFGVSWEATLWRQAQRAVSTELKLGYPLAHKSNGGLDDDGAQLYWSLSMSH